MTTLTLRARPSVAPAEVPATLAWIALVAAGALLGRALYADDPLVRIGNPPLVGSADVRLSPWLLAALAIAAAALAWGPRLALALRWPTLLVTTWAASCAWALALAAGDGIAAPLRSRYEYLPAVDRVGDPLGFLDGFVAALPTFPTHVKGHPPGFLLALAGLDDVGLGGATAAAVLVVATGALAAPALLVAVRSLVDEAAARSAAPFLALSPAALWMATSADSLYMGAATVGLAVFTVAAARDSHAVGLGAGIVLGLALHLSYGIAPLGVVVLAVAVHRRAVRALLACAAGVAAVAASFAAAGFWWLDGLQATRDLYAAGVASRRPYLDFLVIGPAAFALVLGPATAAGLARLRGPLWVLAGSTLVAVLAADLSGLSRGETERIWLPFAPLLIAATAALRLSRPWLAAQLALALLIQATARSPW